MVLNVRRNHKAASYGGFSLWTFSTMPLLQYWLSPVSSDSAAWTELRLPMGSDDSQSS